MLPGSPFFVLKREFFERSIWTAEGHYKKQNEELLALAQNIVRANVQTRANVKKKGTVRPWSGESAEFFGGLIPIFIG